MFIIEELVFQWSRRVEIWKFDSGEWHMPPSERRIFRCRCRRRRCRRVRFQKSSEEEWPLSLMERKELWSQWRKVVNVAVGAQEFQEGSAGEALKATAGTQESRKKAQDRWRKPLLERRNPRRRRKSGGRSCCWSTGIREGDAGERRWSMLDDGSISKTSSLDGSLGRMPDDRREGKSTIRITGIEISFVAWKPKKYDVQIDW